MMETSEKLDGIGPALAKAQAAICPAKKTAQNPHLRNKYADLGSVWEAVQDALNANGISVLQGVSGGDGWVTVTTMLLHSSGQWVRDSLSLPYQENKGINAAQAAGSAITYARRYGLAAITSTPTEDDDGSSAGRPNNGGKRATEPPKEIDTDLARRRAFALAGKAKITDEGMRAYVQHITKGSVQSLSELDGERWAKVAGWIEDGTIAKWLDAQVPH